jgi:pyruvate/2-oxoglutarate dehydrogenase complex dihydrolipoamide acyltransferase (E2) component
LKTLRTIKKTFEGDPGYHVLVGQTQLALDNKDAAVKEIALALEVEPGFQSALDTMAEMGIDNIDEYLSDRRAESAAKADEKARAEAAAKAEASARAQETRAMPQKVAAPIPQRLPIGFERPAPVPGMRDDPLDMARLPELDEMQKQAVIKRGEKILAEAAAKKKVLEEVAELSSSVRETQPTTMLPAGRNGLRPVLLVVLGFVILALAVVYFVIGMKH